MPVPVEFTGPKLTHDVDVTRYFRDCPTESVTQGVFFQYLRDAIERRCGPDERLYQGVELREWTAFRKYPLSEFMTLSVNAARLAFPDEAISEGLRRIGRLAYPSFAATMAGRVVLFAFGENLENVVGAIPRAYAISVPGTAVTTRHVGPKEYRITMRNAYNFVDTYHLGVLEGAVLHFGFQPRITVLVRERPCDADFSGGW